MFLALLHKLFSLTISDYFVNIRMWYNLPQIHPSSFAIFIMNSKKKSFTISSSTFSLSFLLISGMLVTGCDEKAVTAVDISCSGPECSSPVTPEPPDPYIPSDPPTPPEPEPPDPYIPPNPPTPPEPEPPTPPEPCADGLTICANDTNGLGWTMTCQGGKWLNKEACHNASCQNDHCGECMNQNTSCESNTFRYCQDGTQMNVTCQSGCSSYGCLTCKNGDIYCKNNGSGIGELHICSNHKWIIQNCDGACDASGKACSAAPIIEPIVLEPCDNPDAVRCRNDVWLGYIDRCINGHWVQESSCGNVSCMDDKSCGECMVNTSQTCKDGIVTFCNSGKFAHYTCGVPKCRYKGDYKQQSEGDECGNCGYGDSICSEYLPGYGVTYLCDGGIYFGGHACNGPCNETATQCERYPSHSNSCDQEGASYCIDDHDYFYGSATYKCSHNIWEEIKCPRGCNDKHTDCKEVEDIEALRCPENHSSGHNTCYQEGDKYYEKHCENSFWTDPIECPYGCNDNNTDCKAVEKCDTEGATRCKNIGSYGRLHTCLNGIWTNEQSCGYVSCQDDHCGTCANHSSGCLDSVNFGYCHNGTHHAVACRECNVGCYRCQNEGESYCWDYEPGKGEIKTCVNGFWQTQKCKVKNSQFDAPCRTDGQGCRE